MDIRCVVTGQNGSGKAGFVRDAPVAPITLALLPGFEFHRLWGSESVVKLPSSGTAPPDLASAFAELQQKLPGMAEVLEPGNPGMHTTDSVDFDVIVSGEVYLELDDGSEVLLKAGDCVVQNGTRHAWRNRSSANCVVAVTLVGAERT